MIKIQKSEAYPIAQRMANAEIGFCEMLSNLHGLTKEQANHIFTVYKTQKVIKLNLAVSTYNVIHGVYLDRDIIDNALSMEI